jgi:FtsH-binding integral membrane protein
VFGIVGIQLLFSLGMIFAFQANPALPEFCVRNPGFLYGVIALYCVTGCTMSCFPHICRRFPHNYILLGFFTLFTAIMIAFVSATYPPAIVAAAVGITCAIVFGLTIFAMQTKYDFTATFYPFVFMLGFMCIVLPIGMVIAASALDAEGISTLNRIYGALGVIVFSFFIVFDMQMIVGGKHAHQFTPDDYIYASFVLYLDIINLFLKVLQMLGRK